MTIRRPVNCVVILPKWSGIESEIWIFRVIRSFAMLLLDSARNRVWRWPVDACGTLNTTTTLVLNTKTTPSSPLPWYMVFSLSDSCRSCPLGKAVLRLNLFVSDIEWEKKQQMWYLYVKPYLTYLVEQEFVLFGLCEFLDNKIVNNVPFFNSTRPFGTAEYFYIATKSFNIHYSIFPW